MATATDAVQFFDWMAMAGEAQRRSWLAGLAKTDMTAESVS